MLYVMPCTDLMTTLCTVTECALAPLYKGSLLVPGLNSVRRTA